jgi:phage recombination protein Bet
MAAANQLISNVKNLNEIQVDSNTYKVLKETLYPGAKDESIAMVLSYCKARKLDPIKKPVHLVPMNVKTGKKGSDGKDIYEWRDVVMPGIGLYRIEADRSGQYAGMSEPEFGEDITEVIGSVKLTYPKWCKLTVRKHVADRIVEFTAKEYWKENYATKGRNDSSPNAMWEKRAYGQLAKCAEAQALRKAFPDVVGNDYTKEEMEGKSHPGNDDNNYSNRVINKVKDNQKNDVQTFEGEKVEITSEETRDIDQDCLDISWSNDMDELQSIYTKAYKYWTKQKNKENLQRCMDAKDKRKAEIEAALSTIDADTGEVKS